MTEETGITTVPGSGDVTTRLETTSGSGTAVHTPGQLLRATRVARGLSIEEVARTIKFTPRQIEALERDDYASLPGATIVRGFMRSYAKFLQLDATSVLAGYENQMPKLAASMGVVSDIGASLPTPGKTGLLGAGRFRLVMAALALLLAALAYLFWPLAGVDFPLRSEIGQESPPVVPADPAVSRHTSDSLPSAVGHTDAQGGASVELAAQVAQTGNGLAAVTTSPATLSATSVGGAPVPAAVGTPLQGGAQPAGHMPVASSSPLAASAAVANPASPTGASRAQLPAELPQLVFVFADRAWVEVKDATGRVLLAQNSMPQTQQQVSGKPPFDIVIGNASRVKLLYEDQPVDLQPYTKVDVARLRLE